jgi:hypothetical protein
MVSRRVEKEGEQRMKNFKVIIKTDQKNCPLKHRPYFGQKTAFCQWNDFKPCTEKNCPFSKEPKS